MNTYVRFVAAAALMALTLGAPLDSRGQTQSDGTELVQAPASGIRIDRADFYYSGPGSRSWWGSECVALTNTGARGVSQVVLDYAWTRATVPNEFDETYVFNGTLAPGATIGLLNGKAQDRGVCRPTNHGAQTGSSLAQPHVFATYVVYQDRTTWRLFTPIPGSAVNERGSPVALSAVSTYDFAAPTMMTSTLVPAQRLPRVCSTITNETAKTIAGVHILYRHLAANGSDVGDDELDVHTSIAPHGTSDDECRVFFARLQPQILDYAERAEGEHTQQPPAVLYKGVPTVVSASVTNVTFAAAAKSAPSDTMVLQLPSSGIYDGGVLLHEDRDPETGVWGGECAAIVNRGNSALMWVNYDFSWSTQSGDVVVDEEGLFDDPAVAPSTLIAANQPLAPGAKMDLCSPTFHGAQNDSPNAQMQFFVDYVVYQNGSFWSLVPPVAGSAVNTPGSPVTLSDVTTYGSSAPMIVRWQSLRGGFPPEYACSTIQNTSDKAMTDVRILYRHLAVSGADIGDDSLDVRANIPAHAAQPFSCVGFFATMEPDLSSYAQMLAQGPGLEPPVYLYKGMPSALWAQVTSVTFADRSSWKPSP